jgi:hypothetical protein
MPSQQRIYEREVARMDGRAYGQAFAMLVGIVLVLLWACGAFGAPPPQCTLPPRDGTAADDRLTALERRVAELCERLDRPAGTGPTQSAPSVAAGLEVQGAPPAAYTAACGPGGCTAPTVAYAPFEAYTPSYVFPGAFGAAGGGCAGGSCGAQAPAGGFLRAGLFRGRR